MLQMSCASCSKRNINDTDAITRQRETTNFKNKGPSLSHIKYFLQAHYILYIIYICYIYNLFTYIYSFGIYVIYPKERVCCF